METLKGKLPDDFPAKAALEAAGITTYAQVRKAGDLTKIDGIADITAEKINEAMEARTPADQLSEQDKPEAPEVAPGIAINAPEPPAVPQAQARQDQTDADRIAYSGLVVTDTAAGYTVGPPSHYAGANDGPRGRKVIPLASFAPAKGMTVYAPNGEVYAISEELRGGVTDWLRVRSPSGVPLIP